LLDHGISGVDSYNLSEPGSSPLEIALRNADVDILELFVRYELASCLGSKESILRIAEKAGHEELIEIMVKNGAKGNPQDTTPLHTAARRGQVKLAEQLINAGVTLHEKNKDGHTALDIAVTQGKLPVIELFFKQPAITIDNTMYHPSGGFYLFHRAAACGHVEIIKLFIKYGVNINYKGGDGYTPLHCAAINNQASMVEFLIKAGAEINAQNDLAQTPLFCAVNAENIEAIKILLQYGADPHIRSKSYYGGEGRTALELAELRKESYKFYYSEVIIDMLRKSGTRKVEIFNP
jgi:ankyrin repeat protein